MTQQVKDIRLEIKVRNNLILTKVEEAGITGIAELAEKMNAAGLRVHKTQLYKLVSMKSAARGKDDEWIPVVHRLAEFFKCLPEDLFSEPQQYGKLEKNVAKAEVTYAEVRQLTARDHGEITPEMQLQARQLRTAVSRALQTLTPREERVIRLRFGFEGDELTLEEVGEKIGVTRERIRGIEAKALRKLKVPCRSKLILDASGQVVKKYTNSYGTTREYKVPNLDVLKAL